MGTPHPSDRERRAIKHHADKGDESARNYLALLDACTQVLASSDGISLARGMMGEHDDTYGEAIDDALSELMPIIYRCAAGGWESLKYYVSLEQAQSTTDAQDQEAADEMTERLEKLGVSVRIAPHTGDNSYPTEYTITHRKAYATGPTFDRALADFIQDLLQRGEEPDGHTTP